MRLLLKKKRDDLDSYLEMLDSDDTGFSPLPLLPLMRFLFYPLSSPSCLG